MSLLAVGGCDDEGPPTGFEQESIFDARTLDSSEPVHDWEFRICKSGEPTHTEPMATLRFRATNDAGAGQIAVRQWVLKTDYEAGEEPADLGTIAMGEPATIEIETRVPLLTPGEHCGPWNVFQLELEDADEAALQGSLTVTFYDDESPLEDFFVEMPEH